MSRLALSLVEHMNPPRRWRAFRRRAREAVYVFLGAAGMIACLTALLVFWPAP